MNIFTNFYLLLVVIVLPNCICSNNYYILDGANETNSVIKIWHTVIGLLDEYDNGISAGFEILFENNGKHFDSSKGSNWWNYYFLINKIGINSNIPVRIPRYRRSMIRFKTVCEMIPERAKFLINKYLPIQPIIEQKVVQIKDSYWPKNIPLVGIYYKNPDIADVQKTWASLELCNHIKELLRRTPEYKICLFTQLEEFVSIFKKEFSDKFIQISELENNNKMSNSEAGEHELLTLLLLSKCDVVIAPGSYQSVGAKMLNPKLKVIELDQILYKRK